MSHAPHPPWFDHPNNIIPITKYHVLFPLLRSCQRISPDLRCFETFHNKLVFSGDRLLAPTLEDHPLSAVRDCLFSIFTATLHLQPEDVPCCGDK
jgi:hypothetical protein